MVLVLYLTGLLVSCAPSRALAQPAPAHPAAVPELYEITVANSEEHLLAYFSLRNGATPEVVDALRTGIVVRYVYEIELTVPRTFVPKTLISRRVTRTLAFDTLKGEYRVALGSPGSRVISVRTFDEAATLAFQINDVVVLPLSLLLPNQVHCLRLRVRVEKAVSTLPFEALLSIFSPWGYETKWHEISFRY